jgi:hypothetical protein
VPIKARMSSSILSVNLPLASSLVMLAASVMSAPCVHMYERMIVYTIEYEA